MRIVFGLGNPGRRYEATRHNLGYRVVDCLAGRAGGGPRAPARLERLAWVREAELAGTRVLLARPLTFMNECGRAAVALCGQYGVRPADLVVVHDDADLELGRIRVRGAGSAGGHRGVGSLIESLGTQQFARVRLGVRGAGREACELADYVLDEFEPEEVPVAEALVSLGADAVEVLLRDGLETAMRSFNGKSAAKA